MTTDESSQSQSRTPHGAYAAEQSDEFEIIQEDDISNDLSSQFDAMEHAISANFEAFKTKFYKSNRSSTKTPYPAIKPQPSTYDRKKKPTKNDLGSGHPAVIMSDNDKRQQQQSRQAYKVEFESPDQYQICEHHMCYTESESDLQVDHFEPVIYSVSKRNITNKTALEWFQS